MAPRPGATVTSTVPTPGGVKATLARWQRLIGSPSRAIAWRTLRRYLGFVVAANLAWEIAQLPLYTLWDEASAGFIVYAVVHCTAGDVMIAFFALVAALLLCRSGAWPGHEYRRVAVVATLLGVGYTVFSEWHNTAVLVSWTYADRMPVLPPLGTGLAPLAQWIVLPPLAFCWAAPRRSTTIPPSTLQEKCREIES